MANWKRQLDLSFLKPLIESKDPATNKQAREAGKKVAKAIRDFPEGMDSVTQKTFAERFENVKRIAQFDKVLSDLYDYCDAKLIWVRTVL